MSEDSSSQIEIRLLVVRHFMVHDIVVLIELQMQNQRLWSEQRNKIFPQRPHEFIRILDHLFWEAVHSEVDGCKIFDGRIVGEGADVGSRSESRQLIDELDVIGLQEDKICSEFEGQSDCSQGLLISMDMVFLVLEDTFVGACQFCLLGDLY